MIVKDIRYIIKRIIIGVGIALILMLIKGNLFLTVSALTSNTQTITASSHRVNDTVTTVNVSSRNIFGFTFYGSYYNDSTGRVTYNTTNTLDKSKLYDLSFVIYQSNTGLDGHSPVVTYNDNICSVLPFGSLVNYDQTSNLPLFSAFGGWAAPGAITSSGIQSFVDYYKTHPTIYNFSHGFMVSCNNVDIQDLNKVKVYTAQAYCGESSCYYGLSSELWSDYSKENMLIESQKETTDAVKDVNDSIKNDNVTSDTGSSFFDDFSVDNHNGISGIVTAPLRLINSLSSSSCVPLSLPLPFVEQSATLPCMSSVYQQHFSSFLSIYRIITTGLIGYWVLIKLFGHIKGMQNPNDDRIEVFDL